MNPWSPPSATVLRISDNVSKPAVVATTIKLVGGGMNSMMEVVFSEGHPAALIADETKQKQELSYARIKEHGTELKVGFVEALEGDGAPLAATLNTSFGLEGTSSTSSKTAEEALPPPTAKEA